MRPKGWEGLQGNIRPENDDDKLEKQSEISSMTSSTVRPLDGNTNTLCLAMQNQHR